MQTKLNINLPRLTDDDEFESLLRDLCALEWGDPDTKQFGRKGQKQYGVDVYGQPRDLQLIYRGVQCKLRKTDKQLSPSEIEKEVADAKHFPHELDKLIIVTDGPRDTNTQILVDNISDREMKKGGFRVVIWFWEDITERLGAYPRLILKYYSRLFKDITSIPLLERLIDLPIHVTVNAPKSSTNWLQIQECLRFRGLQVRNLQDVSRLPLIQEQGLEDGIIHYFDWDNTNDAEKYLIALVHDLRNEMRSLPINCPIFAILPARSVGRFHEIAKDFLLDVYRIQLLEAEDLPNVIADKVFTEVFPYGYRRRGAINTIDILARSRIGQAGSILLDIDWTSRLSTEIFPSQDEWQTYMVPALKSIRALILQNGELPRIQINSQLPIPASIAVGYYFNIRTARVGVWARAITSSDFKSRFWLSDGTTAKTIWEPVWLSLTDKNQHSAILELTTYVSIQESIQNYISTAGLQVGKWARLSLEDKEAQSSNIEQSVAVAFASQAGQLARQLNSQGVTDIHLFARIPSALAILIGQRLVACGRIHLYWFDNPTYRYAFTLS